jgi:hypothetical protein
MRHKSGLSYRISLVTIGCESYKATVQPVAKVFYPLYGFP